MPRRKEHSGPNHERWLVSYADFITLLFAFFVVMFATAKSDVNKARAVSESVKKALQGESFKMTMTTFLGGNGDLPNLAGKQNPAPEEQKSSPPDKATATDKPGMTLAELMPILAQVLQDEIKNGRLTLHMTSRGLTISFAQTALFPSGADDIATNFYPTIQTIANAMNKVHNPARAEGHTDSIPIHNPRFSSNWELSAARSIALVQLLIKFGVSRDRLSVAGYADTANIDSNNTEQGRRNNRRVDIVILNDTAAKGEPERFPQVAATP